MARSEAFSEDRYNRSGYLFVKRITDILLASIGLLLLFPVFLVVAFLIARQDGFPVVFRQKRLGKGGQEFYIFKFRSMVKNAEEILRSRPDLMEEYKRTFKIENDPRLLKIGKFIRSSSIDELPQLFNVIRGEMSLVGPRPIVPPELEMYGDSKDVYLLMKPGCGGLWQCSGRSLTTYEERVQLDAQYLKSASVGFDFWILYRTVVAILLRRGAH